MNNTSYNVLIGAAVLGLIAGTWGMTQRLLYGLNPVAFGSYVPWGLWVAFYLFFLGLSAGAFLVTTMTYVFRMERFRVIARLSAFTVLICLLCEVLFITLDLGRMARIYRFLITPSFTSLMTWMFVLFNAMLVIYALKTFFLVRGDLVAWANDETRKGKQMVSAPGARAQPTTGNRTRSGTTTESIFSRSSACLLDCCSTAPTGPFSPF